MSPIIQNFDLTEEKTEYIDQYYQFTIAVECNSSSYDKLNKYFLCKTIFYAISNRGVNFEVVISSRSFYKKGNELMAKFVMCIPE